MNETMESSTNLELRNNQQELVTKKHQRVGKLYSIIAIIGFVLLACIVFIFFYQGDQPLPEAQPIKRSSQISLEKIITGVFEPLKFNGTWISDDEILYKNSQGFFSIFNVTGKKSRTVIREPGLAEIAGDIQMSADKKYLMVMFNIQKIYRHSSYFSALIIDIHTQKPTTITTRDGDPSILQLIKWAPKGNGYAYVFRNNIYYKPNAVASTEIQLTFNGNASLSNGVCDWVYEEEIFADITAMWFSPNADKLAYAFFDDTDTDIMPITYYGEPSTMDSQYPKTYNLHYPKPGRANPIVKVFVNNLKNADRRQNTKEMQFPDIFIDPVLGAVTWITNDELCIVLLNRIQNKAVILSCNVNAGNCKIILHMQNRIGWVDMFVPPIFSVNGRRMVFIDSWDQGNNLGGYRHITYHDLAKNRTVPLTRGRFTVNEILSWDNSNDVIYYLATEENKPMKQHVYRIKVFDNEETPKRPECLSCVNDQGCTFANAVFNKRHTYFAQTCAGPAIPSISIYNKYNKKVLTWEDNKHLTKMLANVTLPEKQFMVFPVGTRMEAHVMLLLPTRMDKSGKTKYPLLVNVYGGPDSNQVLNHYKMSWETYFCQNHDVVIAYIDGRGSGLKGDDMLFANYRRLGGPEIEDQISVTRQLQNKFPFIDKKHTGIWGWSYGGYATGMVLATDTNRVFKCGASVAPVTDWIYYDSMYTERFLGLPTDKDNKAGYIASSLVKKAFKLAGKKFMLIHGTLDDNVHYQQSMMLARSLELHDVLFKQQSYPDEVHSLSGVRTHFYHTLESFFTECFSS